MITQIVLKDGTNVAKYSDEWFTWSETGKRMELWMKNPPALLKYWHRKTVVWVIEDEEAVGKVYQESEKGETV